MPHKLISIYLAGSIRDDFVKDIEWREHMIKQLKECDDVIWSNPLAGKSFNRQTKEWKICGRIPDGQFIVNHDFWHVDHADICIFNFNALADGYPNIGSLIEFGRATAQNKLIYSIVPVKYTGHTNIKLFGLHPFIDKNSAIVFDDVDSCVDFLAQYLPVLSGRYPAFAGCS